MKFTTLNSFFDDLKAAMLPLFANSSTESQNFHDNIWLLWQISWLYHDAHQCPAELTERLHHCLQEQRTHHNHNQSDALRYLWMLEIGLPNTAKRTQLPPHAPLIMRDILAKISPHLSTPKELLEHFLKYFAGLPPSEWTRIEDWFASSVKTSPRRILETVSVFDWLSEHEITQILENDCAGAQLLNSGQLKLLPLPANLPRPASFMLNDGSLWLGWPHGAPQTTLDPISQAALVCHEAAHLVVNLNSFKSGGSSAEDSIWDSEEGALSAEWNSLQRACSTQPAKQRTKLEDRWYYENYTLQKNKFFQDWNVFTQPAPQSTCTSNIESPELVISLPFLSAIYACHAERIWIQNRNN